VELLAQPGLGIGDEAFQDAPRGCGFCRFHILAPPATGSILQLTLDSQFNPARVGP
jgi:hypothetical protein